MKSTILVDPSLVIMIIHFVVLAMLRSREEDFLKKYINFIIFTQKLPPLWMGGHEIYNSLSPYPIDATYQIWLRLAQ